MLKEECRRQYEHWKATVTELQQAQGMRDYEKARRDANFRKAEMHQLKTSFASSAGVSNLREFNMNTTRMDRDQFRQWTAVMNEYNREKGRWVDERTETVEMERTTDDKDVFPSPIKKNDHVDKHEFVDPEVMYWKFKVKDADQTKLEKERRDFIDRMYDIHNNQSRVDKINEEGEV